MSETATFRTRTTKGFPRWSMTRYAAARPNMGRAHPRNVSSTRLNQSQSAKPAGATTSSPSPADFRTPTSALSNLHSPRQPSHLTSRAFLHWRLSDDGPGAKPNRRNGPSFETLHISGSHAHFKKFVGVG